MMTNVIAYLHTTFAYQSAAMQLMVGHANFEAQQLHLKESLPIVAPASTNNWNVAMPPDGLTGGFASSNYFFHFSAGRLVWIQPKPRAHGAAPDMSEAGPSLIDTNGAYELARQWLTAISVDVPALEKYPHSVIQFATRAPVGRPRNRPDAASIPTNRVASRAATNVVRAAMPPVFRVTWGGERGLRPAPGRAAVQATVEILGSTKQCIGLRVQNPELFSGPPLQLTNAAALLGPPPPPQHFVEELLGGKSAYDTVAKPDRVVAWLLSSQADGNAKNNRTPAVAVDVNTAGLFSRTLADFNSYSWIEEKNCAPDYGVGLRFTKGADTVDFLLCYECDHLQVTHNGQSAEKDFDAAHIALVQAIKAVFPRDEVINNLSLMRPK
jgi:hypothetical protein